MISLKILIVEDEILIAETIRFHLEEREHEVTDICISFEEAVQSYQLRKPDLILLDIRLFGEKSGIDYANFLKEQSNTPPFVYLTSQYDKRVLDKALDTNPYGYLTKPFRKESLWTSIESAYNLFQSTNKTEEILHFFDGKMNHPVKLSELIYIHADHVYSIVYLTNKRKIIVRNSMQQILESNPFDALICCHRSYIVNAAYVTSWNQENLVLESAIKIPISRSRKKEIIERLNEVC